MEILITKSIDTTSLTEEILLSMSKNDLVQIVLQLKFQEPISIEQRPKKKNIKYNSMDNNVKKEWLSTIDLKGEFGIKISTQNKLRMAGKIPYSKFGKRVFYNRAKINQMLEDVEVCDGMGGA